jgi:tetratricopeptide (TPR) repeat protein
MSRKNKSKTDDIPPPPRFPLKETLCAAAVLLLAGILTYSSSFAGQFIFDDDNFVQDLQANSLWQFLFTPNSLPRPGVSLSLALNYALGGLNVGGYHAFNLLVHLLAALTLFGVVRRTLRLDGLRERFDAAAGWLALAVALLWLVHPLQTESVTYIVQRAESLAGLFYLLTLYCFIRGASRDGELSARKGMQPAGPSFQKRWFALSILACALGMACKPTLATAPLVVFAYDRIFLASGAGAAWRKRWALYAGLAASWLILVALYFISPPVTTAGFNMTALTPAEYAQTQFGVILHYLSLSFWPTALCLDYLWPVARGVGDILPGVLVVGTLAGITLWAWFRRPAWSCLGVWFFVILAPTSSFMPIMDPAFEHRLYLSLAAVVALAVVGVYLLGAAFLRRLSPSEAQRRTLGKLAAAVAISTAAALLGYLTYKRNLDYHDRLAMWRDVVEKRPDNYRAHNNVGKELNVLAKALEEQGKDSAAVARYRAEAFKHFNRALDLHPKFAEACYNRGVVRWSQGDTDGAIADYTAALNLYPGYAEIYYNRGVAREKKGDHDGAISDCDEALKLNPRYAEAYNNRGIARNGKRDFEGAISDCDEALKLNPNYADAYGNRALARQGKNDFDGAIADAGKVLELKPNYAEAHCNRGNARAAKGDLNGAIADYTRALELKPQYAEARFSRGNASLNKCDFAGAISDYDKALEINPRYAEAYSNRGLARKNNNDCEGAIADYTKAVELNPRYAEAFNNRGVARQGKGDCAAAIADYELALSLDHSNWQAWMNKGLLLMLTGKDAEAQQCFAEGLKINPGLRSSFENKMAQIRAERQAKEKTQPGK